MTTIKTASIDGSAFMLLLSARMDEQHNVPLAVKVSDKPRSTYRFVHFAYYDAPARALHLRAMTGTACLDEMLHPLTRTDAGQAREVYLHFTDADSTEQVARVMGLEEARSYQDKFGKHNAVVVKVEK